MQRTEIRSYLFLVIVLILCLIASPVASSGTSADRLTSMAQAPLQTIELVYPLAYRERISSLFDHNGGAYVINGTITIYSGDTVSDDPNDPDDQEWAGDNVWGYTDYDTNLRDLRWDDFSPGWLWYDGHPAYDLTCPMNTPVVAAAAGTVGWVVENETIRIDHSNGYQTYYLHLDGTLVSKGQSVQPGEQIGESGTGGTGAHLHFEVRRNYTEYIDPVGADLWVSGDPIPMGYRDQDGTVHGPYTLDNYKIRQKWLALDGEPGSPLEDDYTGSCSATGAGPLAILHIQGFERGYIQYCGGGSAEYIEYARTYLPDIKAHEDASNWNSTIIIRNDNDSGTATVNVTFYCQDGHVLDSRTREFVPAGGAWTIDARDALIDFLTQAGYEASFSGSAVVAADQDVSVVVENRQTAQRYRYAYTGQAAPATTLYLPQTIHNLGDWHTNIWGFNAGPATADIATEFFNEYGSTQGTRWLSDVAPNGSGKVNQSGLGNGYWGAGRMSANQPVAAVVQVSDSSIYRRLGYSGLATGDTTVWLPFVMTRLSNQWGAVIWIHNTTDTQTRVYLDLYGSPGFPNGVCSTDLYGKGTSLFNLRTHSCGLPWGWYGSARVRFTQPVAEVAVVVNQLNDDAHLGASYEGIPASAASQTVVLPYVVRRYGDRYYSNFTVRNAGSDTAYVDICYYDTDGNLETSQEHQEVDSHVIYNLYTAPPPGLPYRFRGSVVITAEDDDDVIVASSNLLDYSNYYDTISYTGVNR